MIVRKHLALFTAAALLCWAVPAVSAEKTDAATAVRYAVTTPVTLDLKYDIYAGGFDVMSADLSLDLAPKTYKLGMTANTHNFIGKLFPWKGVYRTTGGAAKSGGPVPQEHLATTTWKGTVTRKKMEYDAAGDLTMLTTSEKNKTRERTDIKEDLYKGSVDLLTGMMMIIENTTAAKTCEGVFPVFDGKRRFDIKLHSPIEERLEKSKYSAFQGDTVRCTIKVMPVGGFVKKDAKRGWMAVQSHTEERKHPPLVWFGKGPGDRMIPVRMEIASAYGSVVAHLMTKTAPAKTEKATEKAPEPPAAPAQKSTAGK